MLFNFLVLFVFLMFWCISILFLIFFFGRRKKLFINLSISFFLTPFVLLTFYIFYTENLRNNLSKEAVGQYVSSDYKKELYLQDNNNWQIMSNGNILEEGVWEFNLSEDGYYIEIFKDSCVHFNNYNQYWNYYDSLIIYKNIKGNSTRFSR